jgi:formate hydrogenlyase subunit 4
MESTLPALSAVVQICLALLLAPVLLGVVNRVKAWIAGRRGSPLLQAWYDMVKLLGKSAVYSRTTGWIFRAGPVIGLSAMILCVALVPWGGTPSLLAFDGDLVLLAGLLALGRFVTIAAALDTGSAFEGMGGSREAWFSSLGEPALLLGLAALARVRGTISLAGVFTGSVDLSVPGAAAAALGGPGAAFGGAVVLLAAAALFIVFLAENARIPVDDPNTHLELTMIHEVMVLDHGGVDLAYIQYGASLKLWVLGGLIVSLLAPRTGSWLLDAVVALAGLTVVAALTGMVESIMARLKLVRVPQLLVAALAMSALGLCLALLGGSPFVASGGDAAVGVSP